MHATDTDQDLNDAVKALTSERVVYEIVKNDDGTQRWFMTTHAPLLVMLLVGTGLSKAPKSSDVRIPIDADALEIWGQIRDQLRAWCAHTGDVFDPDDLAVSLNRWRASHAAHVRAGHIDAEEHLDVTRTVQSWVRMIENKFDPPTKLEWKAPCVAVVPVTGEDGELGFGQCGARRIILGGVEAFAIEVNVTTMTATCRSCGATWEGERELMELRFLTNIDERVRTGQQVEADALALWATRRAS